MCVFTWLWYWTIDGEMTREEFCKRWVGIENPQHSQWTKDLDAYTEYVIRREVNRLMEEQGKIMLDEINKEFEARAGNSVEAKPKYKLTFWQRLELIPMWFFWKMTPYVDRKTWHEVKKGMEKHVHKFTVPKNYDGYWFMQCEHEGCPLCEPTE